MKKRVLLGVSRLNRLTPIISLPAVQVVSHGRHGVSETIEHWECDALWWRTMSALKTDSRGQLNTRVFLFFLLEFNVPPTPKRIIGDGDRDPRRWGRLGLYLTLHCHHQNDIALRWAAMWAILKFHLLWRATSQDITTTSERGTSVFSLIRKTGNLHTFWLRGVVATARFETVTHRTGDRFRPCLTWQFGERCSRHSATDSPDTSVMSIRHVSPTRVLPTRDSSTDCQVGLRSFR